MNLTDTLTTTSSAAAPITAIEAFVEAARVLRLAEQWAERGNTCEAGDLVRVAREWTVLGQATALVS